MPDNSSPGGGSSGPASGALVSSNNFQQQGSVSWVDLVDTTLSGTVGILSRYSAAGVDPYTALVAQKLCNNFALPPVGRRHIEDALSGLHCFGNVGKALWFGFGIKHLVHTLADSEQGSICLALCAGLMECYSEPVGAEIFVEMVNLCDAPADLKPSVHQWKALMTACAGVFASTPFPIRLEFFRRLCYPGASTSWKCSTDLRWHSTVESIAEVLLALGKVSRRELVSITILGGQDAGWVVAMAEWIFGLTININDANGELVYKKGK